MTLQEYLKASSQSNAEFAREYGCHVRTIDGWISGRMKPSAAAKKRIAEMTGGEAGVNEWPVPWAKSGLLERAIAEFQKAHPHWLLVVRVYASTVTVETLRPELEYELFRCSCTLDQGSIVNGVTTARSYADLMTQIQRLKEGVA